MKIMERAAKLKKRFVTELQFYRLVLKHPETPRTARFFLGATIAYIVSPIDIIPDFIPVVGFLDELIVVPVLVWLAVRLIPASVITECRNRQAAGLD